MAIKLTREGNKTFAATCNHCNAGFTYELNDIMGHSEYSGGFVCCPSCSTRYTHPPQQKSLLDLAMYNAPGLISG